MLFMMVVLQCDCWIKGQGGHDSRRVLSMTNEYKRRPLCIYGMIPLLLLVVGVSKP